MSLEDEMRRKIAQRQKEAAAAPVAPRSATPTPKPAEPKPEPEQAPLAAPVEPKVEQKPVEKPPAPAVKPKARRTPSKAATAPKRLSISSDAIEACRSHLIQMDEMFESCRDEVGFASTLTNSDVVMFAIGMLLRSTNIDGMSAPVAARVQYCLNNGDTVADLKESWSRRFDAIDKRLHEINIGVQVGVQANILTVMDRYGFAPKNAASAEHPGSINFIPTGWEQAFSACRTAARNRMNQEHRPH